MLINVAKLNAQNNNIVLTLSNAVNINVEIDNVNSTLFNVVNFNVDLALSDVATKYHPSNNVETILKCLLSIEECF